MRLMPADLFRRNLIGLLVVTAVLATLYLTEYRANWSAYRDTVVAEHSAVPGGSVEVGGLTWSIKSTRHYTVLPGSLAHELPEGTGALVVTIDRQGTGENVICGGVITDGTRRWRVEGIGFTSAPLKPGTTDNCSAPGPVQFTFILPREARPTAVDVLAYNGGIMVRLGL